MSKRIIILGGGFAGLEVAKGLRKSNAKVTLIDKRNHHLFQPLLYQVATGQISPSNISSPLRTLLKKNKNTEVLMAEVAGFDVANKTVKLTDAEPIPYDTLVVAVGAVSFYFNNETFEKLSTGLKSLQDAEDIRARLVRSFEEAERQARRGADKKLVKALMTFVVVGGGPTGLELAGAIAEASRETLQGEFRHIDPSDVRVVLVEANNRVLPPFPEKLSHKAGKMLEGLGVEVRTGWMMADITPTSVKIKPADKESQEGEEVIYTRDVFWGAGVKPSPLIGGLVEQTGAEADRAGRIHVEADCSVKNHPEIFVLGDAAHYEHGEQGFLPGTAAVASQQGKYLGQELLRRETGIAPRNFSYVNKGSMATIGRGAAVVDTKMFKCSGWFAWQVWLYLHLMLLNGFQNRLLVWFSWVGNFFTGSRPARIVPIENGSGMVDLEELKKNIHDE